MRLNGKKAFVTGAARGIGKEIVLAFLREGADVWALDLKEGPAKAEMDAEAAKAGKKLVWKYGDISNEADVNKICDEITAESGGVDILVNNAGITKDGLVFRMTLEDWEKVIKVNLTGAFFTSRAIARDMIRRRTGSIINMSSIVGVHGAGGQCNYSASKAGLIGLTKSLAQEVASRGVRANAIAPGYIETEMTGAIPEDAKKAIMAKIPMVRTGKPSDIASACVFLGSDDSSYITGIVLPVDGGMGV